MRNSYLKEYFIAWNEWGPQDFGKPNLEKVHTLSTSVAMRCRVYRRSTVDIRRAICV